MKNKGFTLIELLAVIVVLAIIALIVTPVISRVIDGAKKSAVKQSAVSYVKAVDSINQVALLEKNLGSSNALATTRMGVDINELDVEVNGQKPTEGFVDIVNNKVIRAFFCIDKYTAEYLDGKVELEESDDCKKEVIYGTADVSDMEDEYAVIERTSPDPSWKYYLKLTGYGKYLAEASLCNNLNGAITCISSNDIFTKENLVKESNIGLLNPNYCEDYTPDIIEEVEGYQNRENYTASGFYCSNNQMSYSITKYDLKNNLASEEDYYHWPQIIYDIYLGDYSLEHNYHKASCYISPAIGKITYPESMNRYIDMSKNEFMNLTFAEYTEFVRTYVDEENQEYYLYDENEFNEYSDEILLYWYSELKGYKIENVGGRVVKFYCYHNPYYYQ